MALPIDAQLVEVAATKMNADSSRRGPTNGELLGQKPPTSVGTFFGDGKTILGVVFLKTEACLNWMFTGVLGVLTHRQRHAHPHHLGLAFLHGC